MDPAVYALYKCADAIYILAFHNCLYIFHAIANNIISRFLIPCIMQSRLYKEVHFDASHRLLHYQGKCACLHGHRWRVEVWMEGRVAEKTGILVDYNTIKEVVERLDHQIILNQEDPLVRCIRKVHPVVITPGEPTSELLASLLCDQLHEECRKRGHDARVTRLRVWESPGCYAERVHAGN